MQKTYELASPAEASRVSLSPMRLSAFTPHVPRPAPAIPTSGTVRGALLHGGSPTNVSVCVGGHGIWGSWGISFISVLGPDSFRSLFRICQDGNFLNEAERTGFGPVGGGGARTGWAFGTFILGGSFLRGGNSCSGSVTWPRRETAARWSRQRFGPAMKAVDPDGAPVCTPGGHAFPGAQRGEGPKCTDIRALIHRRQITEIVAGHSRQLKAEPKSACLYLITINGKKCTALRAESCHAGPGSAGRPGLHADDASPPGHQSQHAPRDTEQRWL